MAPETPSNELVHGRVSFVVPTKNSERTIEACVASLRHQRIGGDLHSVEVIMVDNHSTDGTAELAAPYCDRVESLGPERSAQRNYGMHIATGEFIAFVDSDMIAEPLVAQQAVEQFRLHERTAGLVIPERAFGNGMWAAARQLEKDLYLGDSTVEAARIFRTEAVRAVGGYDETINSREDWDLADRVAMRWPDIGRVSALVWHDEGDISVRDMFKKKRYYGKGVLDFTPNTEIRGTTAQRIKPLARALVAHPVAGSSLVVLKAVEYAGFSSARLGPRP